MAVLNSVVMSILNCRLIRALKSPSIITLLEKLKDVPTIRPQLQSLICMNRQAELGMAVQTDTHGLVENLTTSLNVSGIRLMETQ